MINAATNTAGTAEAMFPPVFDAIYDYAWFIGVGVGALVHWFGMTFTKGFALER